MVIVGMGVLAAAVLVSRRRPGPPALLAAALVVLAGLATAQAFRLDDYAFWFGVPVIAATLGRLVDRFGGRAGGDARQRDCVGASVCHGAGERCLQERRISGQGRGKSAAADLTHDPCLESKAYDDLARVPAGVVLAPIDLGPFILAHTPSSAISAPYHRMAWGILAARPRWTPRPPAREVKVRRLNARYVLDCPTDQSQPRPGGLLDDLRRRSPPPWLRPLPSAGRALKLYAVAPATSATPNLDR